MGKQNNLYPAKTEYQVSVENARATIKAHASALIEAHNRMEHGIKLHRKGGNYTSTPLFKTAEEEKQKKLF